MTNSNDNPKRGKRKAIPCPTCGSPLKLGKREEHAGEISRYRRCKCGYVDRAWYQPEKMLRTEQVRQRPKSVVGNDSASRTVDKIAV